MKLEELIKAYENDSISIKEFIAAIKKLREKQTLSYISFFSFIGML